MTKKRLPYSLTKTDTGYWFGSAHRYKQNVLRWAAEEAEGRGYGVTVKDRNGVIVGQFDRRGNRVNAMTAEADAADERGRE